MKYRKYVSGILALSLAGLLSVGLCGCRASDEIKKVVHTTDASEVDEDEIVRHDDIDAEEMDDASTEKKTDNQAKETKQESAAVLGTDANTDQTVKVADPNQQGDRDDPDAKNEQNGNAQNDNSANGVNGNSGGGNTSGDGSKEGNQGEEDEVYDPDGKQQQIPEVDGYIAAPGEAGLIVQMLGGEDVLCASSDSLLSNHIVQQVFADEGIENVQTLWEGDGSEGMSEENFSTLLAMEPEAVVTISGKKNFSDSQLQKLESAGVKRVTIDLTSAANIEGAVEAVGQLLGDHPVGNTTSIELAAEYVTYEQELVKDVASKKGYFFYSNDGTQRNEPWKSLRSISNGYFTFILWDWDADFSFQYYGFDGVAYVNQSGGAVTKTGWSDSPATYYMSSAGVMNTTMRYQGSSKKIIYLPFHQILADGGSGDSESYASLYFTDIISSGTGTVVSGTFTAGDRAGGSHNGSYIVKNGKASAIDNVSNRIEGGYTKLDSYGWSILGDFEWIGGKRFPYLIAASQDIKEKMDSSMESDTGLYKIRPWGIEIPGYQYSWKQDNGFFTNFKNNRGTTFQEYEIEVNPYGCGSWLDGSVESVLESVWVSNLYYGDETYSDSDMKKAIQEFYQKFYRQDCSGQLLDDILDGM